MRRISFGIFILASVLAFSISALAPAAAVQLGSGSKDFTVNPILLSDIPLEPGDYCGNPKYPQTQNFRLGLSTSPGFLNIRWNARDPGGIEREIGVDCWMNCPATSNLQANCAGFQACNYRGPTGKHACSIQGPSYKYSSDNSVVCRFFDPLLPLLDLDIESRFFKTVDYEVDTPPITITVGSPVTVPIDLKSFGIVNNSFAANMSALQNGQLVLIQNGVSNTPAASCGDTVRTFPSVSFLAATKVAFSILSHSSIDSTACSSDSQCSYLDNDAFKAQCVSGKCWKRLDISIDAGLASLSEYGIGIFILILVAATAVFFLARRKS